MGLRFDAPWLLLFIVPTIGFYIWMVKRNVRLSGFRKMFAAGIRILIFLLLICSLAGMQWFVSVERKAAIFTVDRSDSMIGEQQLSEWIKEASKTKGKEDDVGIVSVGLDAVVDRNPSSQDLQSFEFNTKVNQQFSNLTSGLQLAENIAPADASSRIVLLSDGKENVGDILRQGKLLKDKGISVDVLSIEQYEAKDVSIERLAIPERLYQGEKYTLEVAVNSTFAASGELRIYEDNQEISSQEVQIERGENHFALQSLAKESGFHRYRAEIFVDADAQSANNASFTFSRVTGPPKVLVVEGQSGASHNITSVLDSSFIPYDVIPPEMLSVELASYTSYDSIVFNNVSATRLSAVHMNMIEQAVRDYGVGFLMIGGEESFGLGGYFKTPIERTLPVYMDLRGKRQIPSLGLILVIDKSGSMSGGKMELAKEAAIRTVELMRDQDTIGVVAFDSSPWWVVEPQSLTNREDIIEDISSIQEDGGTEIYTAVEEAYYKLLDVSAQRKHIILLTDGQSATNQSFEQLTTNMATHNMTLSSVAIGDGADQQLLEHIANLAKGRYYFTNDQSTIPAIFSREAVLISRTYIVDQPFVPAVGQGGDWRSLFQQSLPQINAYIATTAKETAEVVLMSPEPDPLLARWQYGAGKSVAWTSDIQGKWSSEWVNWDQFPKIFSEMIKWTFPQFHTSPFQLSSRLDGDQAIVEVKSSAQDFQGELKAVITDDSLEQREILLTPTLPGEYQAEFDVTQPGVYLTRIDVYDDLEEENTSQELIGSVTSGFVIPYSPEYKISPNENDQKLERLAEMTGGRVLSLERPEEVFAGEVVPKKKFFDMSYYLLLAALFFWIIDIANRRLSVPWNSLKRLITVNQKTTSNASLEKTVTMERLSERKMKISKRFEAIDAVNSDLPIRSRGEKGVNSDENLHVESVSDIPNSEEDKNERMNRLLAAKQRRKR